MGTLLLLGELVQCAGGALRPRIADRHHHFPSHAHQSDCICFQAQGRAQRCKGQSCSLYHQRQQLFQAARPRRCPQGSGQRVCGNMERRPAAHRPDEQDRLYRSRRRAGCPALRNKAATLTNAAVYLDGKPLSLTAYSIGGNNYFKLRDLVFALGFSVDWDNATSTVTISAQ